MPGQGIRRGVAESFDFEGDGEQAREWLDTAYGASLGLGGQMGTVHHQRRTRGSVSFDRLQIDAPVRFDAEAMPTLVVVDVFAGELEYTRDSVTDQGREGDTVLAAGWDMPFSGRGNGYDVRNISVSAEALDSAIADIDLDKTAADLTFARYVPRSPAAAAQWRAVVDRLSAPLSAPVDSLARVESSRLLANSLLHTFDNNLVTDAMAARDVGDATQATVRRAQRLIDERAGGDLTLSDIARACSVTPRSLQYAFRRHLDCTPHAYLRRVRLDLVHQALRDGSVSNVGDAAARFGFFNPGRFAAEYRQVFGENPGQTLLRHSS
ncbi:helix-turn-helix transcriptional regulator [Nocardioides sp. zg-1228]|uniref:helix-turn-helix transcriptional regulator n=1 Tax=Nocardioides sp. zg-1228 TaxID=2763008 RepID=UPI0016430C50|nr:helix-turn-helix transcriptional regulator [Nocardioides sp. zg-1228]MBC2932549.1 helix-turn-helix transcriptional regulator [Nocardioides sp. zg-1228]QSF58047.1 helix-turn-helix transcriptional regulator [Nocardioides sp. zg-1228]